MVLSAEWSTIKSSRRRTFHPLSGHVGEQGSDTILDAPWWSEGYNSRKGERMTLLRVTDFSHACAETPHIVTSGSDVR